MKSGPPTLPELLAPAGSFEKLVTAIHYGADAVYLSGKNYGLRAKAANFDEGGIEAAVAYAHDRGVKVYVTVNIIAHEEDFRGLDTHIRSLAAAGADAIIVADPGILRLARQIAPALPIHLSTQANVTNGGAAAFWVEQGVSRLNLARELSLAEIGRIREATAAQIEVFAHGALCISYSGRCLLSSYLTGRDANRGNCAHPCRYGYALVEEKRPGEYFPVVEDERGTYLFNSRDLCLLPVLPQLVGAGVDSLKIEGRMKSIFYVGGVVRVYRAALDYLAGLAPERWREPEQIELPGHFAEEIEKTGTRGVSLNFAHRPPGPADMLYRSSRLDQDYEPVAVVKRSLGPGIEVELRTVCRTGEEVEYMHRSLAVERCRVRGMRDAAGIALERGNPGALVRWELEGGPVEVEAHAIFRRRSVPARPAS